MSNFTVEDLKRLREATSLGMVECKRALEETGGDYNKALELIRQVRIEHEVKVKAAADGVLQLRRDAAERKSVQELEKKVQEQEKEEKLQLKKSSAQMSKLQLEVDLLQREVIAIKKAHNALLAALEKAAKTTPGRTTTTYTGFYIGEF